MHEKLPKLPRVGQLNVWLGGLSRNPSFDAAEHRALGDAVKLVSVGMGVIPQDWDGCTLRVSPHASMSYGEIVALAGDLYGVADEPISDAAEFKDQKKRFRKAYAKLYNATGSELADLRRILREETEWLWTNLREGKWPNDAYREQNFDDKYNHATGASWTGLGGRYGDLALQNFDHFGHDAVSAYRAGHAVALEAAKATRDMLQREHNSSNAWLALQQALAMSAFADHYLTDLFAAGHLRVPRRSLGKQSGSNSWFGAAMAKHHHLEDNTYGLFVENAKGDRWQCFGDEYLLTPQAYENKKRAIMAVQISASEVMNVFETGNVPGRNNYQALQLTPNVDQALRAETNSQGRPYLNYQAQFHASSLDVVTARAPMNNINSRATAVLPMMPIPAKSPESPFEHFADEIYNQLFGHARQMYGPPDTALPVPQAPALSSLIPTASHEIPNPRRVRYAVCYVGEHVYLDGKVTKFLSAASPWTDWIERVPQFAPSLLPPPFPIPSAHHVVPTGYSLIRQYEGRQPEIDLKRYEIRATNFVDEDDNPPDRDSDLRALSNGVSTLK